MNTTLTLDIPKTLLASLGKSPAQFAREMRVAAALHWYETGRVNEEEAARIADLDRAAFARLLNRSLSQAFVLDLEAVGA